MGDAKLLTHVCVFGMMPVSKVQLALQDFIAIVFCDFTKCNTYQKLTYGRGLMMNCLWATQK
jgi:hypothetical protein